MPWFFLKAITSDPLVDSSEIALRSYRVRGT